MKRYHIYYYSPWRQGSGFGVVLIMHMKHKYEANYQKPKLGKEVYFWWLPCSFSLSSVRFADADTELFVVNLEFLPLPWLCLYL